MLTIFEEEAAGATVGAKTRMIEQSGLDDHLGSVDRQHLSFLSLREHLWRESMPGSSAEGDLYRWREQRVPSEARGHRASMDRAHI